MRKRDQAVVFLRAGLTPGEISEKQGVRLDTILGYLDEGIGRGQLRRYDVLLTIPSDAREAIREADLYMKESAASLAARLTQEGVPTTAPDVQAMRRYGSARFALGDLYEELRHIEVGLHGLIKAKLQAHLNDAESEWWRRGLPTAIREKLGARWAAYELDSPPDPYSFTDLIDLRVILDKQWAVLGRALPPETRANKKALLSDLRRLNEIRRKVMHPVRGEPPTDCDFELAWDLRHALGLGEPPGGFAGMGTSSLRLAKRRQTIETALGRRLEYEDWLRRIVTRDFDV